MHGWSTAIIDSGLDILVSAVSLIPLDRIVKKKV